MNLAGKMVEQCFPLSDRSIFSPERFFRLLRQAARANASKLLLITTKVKNQRKNQHFSFDLFYKPQSDR
ncbi:hypothetical protein [Nostoc sp.]|uniref:hypothetical protein n=1 Tax=Nostoc sp. TaxID=1180 RepID=UPI002FF95D9E